ncbi:zinc-binding dehydrogenase [Frateuria aurantia]
MTQAVLPASYRAWSWVGGARPEDLQPTSKALYGPGAGQVLVRNVMIGLNPVDWKVLDGGLDGWVKGHVPGVDAAGEVVAVGPGVMPEWLGRRVAYHTSLQGPGSFAEYTPVAARALLRLPDGLSFELAATLPSPGLTAWMALEKLPLAPGQPLLISGAGGAVGQFLLQLAIARGFVVTAMANPRHWPRLEALGAVRCIPGPLAEAARPDGERRYFAVIDTVNAAHAERMASVLRANGHLVCIQGRSPEWPCPPFGLALSMHEVALGALHVHGDDLAWARLTAAGEAMATAVEDGRLQTEDVVIEGFEQLPYLLEALRQRSFSGKPLIRV